MITKWWAGDLLSLCRLSAITRPCLSLGTIRVLNWGELTPSSSKVYDALTCFLYCSFLLIENYFSSGHFPWDLGLHWRKSCSDAVGKANVVVVSAQRLLQAAAGSLGPTLSPPFSALSLRWHHMSSLLPPFRKLPVDTCPWIHRSLGSFSHFDFGDPASQEQIREFSDTWNKVDTRMSP